jgi:hypothetical protein
MRHPKSMIVGLAAASLVALSLAAYGLGSRPAGPDAAAAVLRLMLSELKDSERVAGCVGLAGPHGESDFPPRTIDDLVAKFPGLHPASECEEDAKNRANYLKAGRRRGERILCVVDAAGAERSRAMRIEFLVVHGPLDAEGRSFEVSRSLLGRMIVKDLGVRWAS